MSRAGSWSRAGFTLVELALALLLIGLFSAVALPRLAGLGGDGLEPSARRLAGTVKHLYNEAALSGRPHRLTLDLDRGAFVARRLEEDGELVAVGGRAGRGALKGTTRLREVRVAGRGAVTSGEATMEFSPVGWVEETVLHLDDGHGRGLTLRIEPFTATTEIYEGFRDF